eukprot:2743024-Amphidinium_carterae.1
MAPFFGRKKSTASEGIASFDHRGNSVLGKIALCTIPFALHGSEVPFHPNTSDRMAPYTMWKELGRFSTPTAKEERCG